MKLQKPITLILNGRSGCGKGTQVKLLTPLFRPVRVIKVGELLRTFVATQRSIAARKANTALVSGNLVPSWLATHMWIHEIIQRVGKKDNILLDGGVREKTQALALDGVIRWLERPLPVTVHISITEQEAAKRLLKRGREDDAKSAIQHRMKFFRDDVVPTLAYYQKAGRLITVDGVGSITDVFKKIRKAVGL